MNPPISETFVLRSIDGGADSVPLAKLLASGDSCEKQIRSAIRDLGLDGDVGVSRLQHWQRNDSALREDDGQQMSYRSDQPLAAFWPQNSRQGIHEGDRHPSPPPPSTQATHTPSFFSGGPSVPRKYPGPELPIARNDQTRQRELPPFDGPPMIHAVAQLVCPDPICPLPDVAIFGAKTLRNDARPCAIHSRIIHRVSG